MKTLNGLIDPHLLRQARIFASMTDSVRKCLAAESARHCWVGGVHDQTLVVVTDHSGHAMRIHYLQREILDCINSNFGSQLPAPLTRLRLKVRAMPAPAVKSAARPSLSADNARQLLSTANGIPDPGVKAALKQLARRGIKA